jgi:xylan 1,4-beta-xylosidase
MRGNPDSCGVWAPCLSHADGRFWLVYTDVKRLDGNFKDAHNYLVTASEITGRWSDPVYLNSSGFDPSLFHDDDGRKWLVNMQWKHTTDSIGGKPKHPAFDGILCQEYDPVLRRLTGPIRNIFPGSPHGLVEAPHLFRRDGWYYLTTAEGGTGYNHSVTMARSSNLHGPYELHPDGGFLMTSKDSPDAPLQRAGHGQVVETPDGLTYHTHLCGRPLPGVRRCPLGRETGIQLCAWGDDGWLRLEHGGHVPALEVPAPPGAPDPEPDRPVEYRFDGPALPSDFQWLRTPYPERIFTLTGDALRLHARESIGSWFEQALVARRQEHFRYRAETRLSFEPDTYQQAAGLTIHKFHFLAVTHDPARGRVLTILSCPGDWPDSRLTFPLESPVPLPDGPVDLAVSVTDATQRFHYRAGGDWQPIGPELDASVISDEGGRGEHASFTGAFVGMAAFDTAGRARPADFAWFTYTPG